MHTGERRGAFNPTDHFWYTSAKKTPPPTGKTSYSHGTQQQHPTLPLPSRMMGHGESHRLEKGTGQQPPQLGEAADPGLSSPFTAPPPTYSFHSWLCASTSLLPSAPQAPPACGQGSREGAKRVPPSLPPPGRNSAAPRSCKQGDPAPSQAEGKEEV